MRLPFASLALVGLLLSSCSSPPVRFYTLGAPAIGNNLPASTAPETILAVDPVIIPDYLDSQDILVRDGDLLDRSANGRWASRLSRGVTDLVTAQLSRSWPSVFVTTHPSAGSPQTRLVITINRLDITKSGQGTLEADWSFVPTDEHHPVARQRASFSAQGSVATDDRTAALTRELVNQLAVKIGTSAPVM
ncbi:MULTISPECIES: membrane integrity-associated transporter subunit PqiC [unclassified Gluconobacter]|uniref:PqiC family protein n=1 Tax=unclassified Gluconobacter TaxID=2644261 RepID=UPI001C05B87D|nr:MULTISPECIES: PqiC family protein [unclassified Gluconobacter]